MAPNSSILAWETPWTEEPGGIQSLGLQRVGHDVVTEQEQIIKNLLSMDKETEGKLLT